MIERVRLSKRINEGGNYFSKPSSDNVQFFSSGCKTLDLALGGGWAERRVANIVGDKCLSGDTIVSACRGSKVKKMDLRTLYNRVNGDHPNRNPNVETYLLSDLGGYVGQNKVLEVRKTGTKELFQITDQFGASIKASKDHRFLTKDGWQTIASGLTVGSLVYSWRGKKSYRNKANRHVTFSIPYHPHAWQHVIAGRNYKRMLTARLVIEAAMNNIDLEDFIHILRNDPDEASTLAYSDPNLEVHHLDGNPMNDDLNNLELLVDAEHWSEHAEDMARDTNRTQLVEISSIESVGVEPTFDISMEGPHHNFIADGFVVHNSTGKTLLCIEAAANFAIKHPKGKIRYREAEAAFNKSYAAALGFPVERVDFGQQILTVEELFKDMHNVIDKARNDELYIVDSLDALSDEAEQARDIDQGSYGGAKAKKMSELFRRLNKRMNHAKVTMIIVSQIRDKIGVTFGRKVQRSGGHALDFYASQVAYLAYLHRLNATRNKITRATGVTVKAMVEKNKVGLPFRDAQFDIQFGFGIDDAGACLDWLEANKFLADIRLKQDKVSKYRKELATMSPADFKEELTDLHKAVERRWNEIEVSFQPTRKKYA